jgi:hypothetical protein
MGRGHLSDILERHSLNDSVLPAGSDHLIHRTDVADGHRYGVVRHTVHRCLRRYASNGLPGWRIGVLARRPVLVRWSLRSRCSSLFIVRVWGSESGVLGDHRPSGWRSFLTKEVAGGSKPSTPTTESLAGSGHQSSTIQHHPDRKPLPGRQRPQPGADARRADSRTKEQGQAQIDRMLAR